jgi:hypothetical protein
MWDCDELTEDDKRRAAHPFVPWLLVGLLLASAAVALIFR